MRHANEILLVFLIRIVIRCLNCIGSNLIIPIGLRFEPITQLKHYTIQLREKSLFATGLENCRIFAGQSSKPIAF
jgi:hypothetical protein